MFHSSRSTDKKTNFKPEIPKLQYLCFIGRNPVAKHRALASGFLQVIQLPFITIKELSRKAGPLIQNGDFVVAYLVMDRQTSLALLQRVDVKRKGVREIQHYRANMSK